MPSTPSTLDQPNQLVHQVSSEASRTIECLPRNFLQLVFGKTVQRYSCHDQAASCHDQATSYHAQSQQMYCNESGHLIAHPKYFQARLPNTVSDIGMRIVITPVKRTAAGEGEAQICIRSSLKAFHDFCRFLLGFGHDRIKGASDISVSRRILMAGASLAARGRSETNPPVTFTNTTRRAQGDQGIWYVAVVTGTIMTCLLRRHCPPLQEPFLCRDILQTCMPLLMLYHTSPVLRTRVPCASKPKILRCV